MDDDQGYLWQNDTLKKLTPELLDTMLESVRGWYRDRHEAKAA
jgi:hypothetical protein